VEERGLLTINEMERLITSQEILTQKEPSGRGHNATLTVTARLASRQE
jgi:hypothetical protein